MGKPRHLCMASEPDSGFLCRRDKGHEGNHKHWRGHGFNVSWGDAYAVASEARSEEAQPCTGCAGSLRWDETAGVRGAAVCIGCHQLPRDCECEPYPLEADVPELEVPRG